MKEVFDKFKALLFNRYTGSIAVALSIDYFYKDSTAIKALMKLDIGIALSILIYFLASLIVIAILAKLFSTADPIFNNKIIEKINKIIDESNKRLVIVSPYVNMGNTLVEKLISRAKSGVEITIYHNTSELQKAEFLGQFSRLSSAGVKFYNHPRLHAKIVLNEGDAVVSSLNMLVTSIENSLEAGYHVSYGPKMKEIETFIHEIRNSDLCTQSTPTEVVGIGYCIKTKKEIEFNKWKPIEYSIYVGLRDSGKMNDDGDYCHFCGKRYRTSVKNPFCDEHQSMN